MTRDDGREGDSLIVFHNSQAESDAVAAKYYGDKPHEHGKTIDGTFYPAGPIECAAGVAIVAASYYTVSLERAGDE